MARHWFNLKTCNILQVYNNGGIDFAEEEMLRFLYIIILAVCVDVVAHPFDGKNISAPGV